MTQNSATGPVADAAVSPILVVPPEQSAFLGGCSRKAVCPGPVFAGVDGDELVVFIRAGNFERRDLTPAQRVAAVLRLAGLVGNAGGRAGLLRRPIRPGGACRGPGGASER